MPPKKSKPARGGKKKTVAPRQIVISSDYSDNEALTQKRRKMPLPKDHSRPTSQDHSSSPKPETDAACKKQQVIHRPSNPESSPQGAPSEEKQKFSHPLKQNEGSQAQDAVLTPLPQQNDPTPLTDESTAKRKLKKVSRVPKRQRASQLREHEPATKKAKLPEPLQHAPSLQSPGPPTDLQRQETTSTRSSPLQARNVSHQVQEGDSSPDLEGHRANKKQKKLPRLVKKATSSRLQGEVMDPQMRERNLDVQLYAPIPDPQPYPRATSPREQILGPQLREPNPIPHVPDDGMHLRSSDHGLSQSREQVLDFQTGAHSWGRRPKEDTIRFHPQERAASPQRLARVLSPHSPASGSISGEFSPALVMDDLASVDEPRAEATTLPTAAEPNVTQEVPYSPHLGMTPPINPKPATPLAPEPEDREASVLAEVLMQQAETSTPEHDAIPPITTVDMVRHTSDFLPTTHQFTVTTMLKTRFTLPNFAEPHPRSSKRTGDEGIRFALNALDMERERDRLANVLLERAVLLKIRSSEAVLRLENEIEGRLQEHLEEDYPGLTTVLNDNGGAHSLDTEENTILAQGNPGYPIGGYIAGSRQHTAGATGIPEQQSGGYYEQEEAHDRVNIGNGKSRADGYGGDLEKHDRSHREAPAEYPGWYARGYGYGEAVIGDEQHARNRDSHNMNPQEAHRTLVGQPSGLFYGHGYGGGATGRGEVQEEDRGHRDAVPKEGHYYRRSSDGYGKPETDAGGAYR